MSDHSSGTGLMLALNGSSVATDILWRQIVSANMNTTYTFSGWGASWGLSGGNTDPSPANLRISINDLALGDRVLPSQAAFGNRSPSNGARAAQRNPRSRFGT
jgi:hypothetical protein